MVTILYPMLALLAGLIVYVLPANGKINELGRIAYMVGMFWVLYALSRTVVHF